MNAAVPWVACIVALFGFFGLLLKVRVSGDPALWTRIESLELRLDRKDDAIFLLRKELDDKLVEERAECDRRLDELEGEIRLLLQREATFGAVDTPLSAPLRKAFPVKRRPRGQPDQDADLLRKIK